MVWPRFGFIVHKIRFDQTIEYQISFIHHHHHRHVEYPFSFFHHVADNNDDITDV